MVQTEYRYNIDIFNVSMYMEIDMKVSNHVES
jgi:hypothetical protein